jgi:hypothetical protein
LTLLTAGAWLLVWLLLLSSKNKRVETTIRLVPGEGLLMRRLWYPTMATVRRSQELDGSRQRTLPSHSPR